MDSLATFLDEIRQFPLLSAEEEKELALRYRSGDEAAVKRLASCNLRLVVSIAKEYSGRGVPLLDLISGGHEGLMLAACKFDPDRECRFSTYATDWIHRGVRTALKQNGSLIHVTNYGSDRIRKVQEARSALEKENGEPPTEREIAEAEKAAIRAIVEKLPYSNLSLEGWNGDALTEKFDSPVWEELYKPCLACGTCTFVCPTCQCYDIKDYDTGHGVKRYRCWDSCMYSDFTMMAHGNNRTSQMQRFRQRFMHKLVYFPANNDGMYSCVGCGRCVDKCPASLNIVKVIKAFENQGGNE